YWWFTYTVGGLVGNLAFIVVLGPAVIDGCYFGLAAALAALAYGHAPRATAPLAAAAAFTILEWVRSIGPVGVPFAQLGYSQALTPLAVFAAYIGTYGVTFVICVLGAYLADAITYRTNLRLGYCVATLIFCWAVAWLQWPARSTEAPTMRVAAIQGNIAQAVKFDKPGQHQALHNAVRRYTALSEKAAAFRPQLIAWPETVIPTTLSADPNLSTQFGALARRLRTTLLVGSQDFHGGAAYNALFVYGPDGRLGAVYDKRQLVPFAESFPAKRWLGWLPYAGLIADYGHGTAAAVYPAAFPFAPLICWESAFADLAHAQLRQGAQLFIVSTDDAWFGETAGPYAHAKIAQMRAIESGTWILRAASTGISGIIAPDGRYVIESELGREAIVLGSVGRPPGSVFAKLGPTLVSLALCAVYLAVILFPVALRRA
ncbi:MAG: apolipoprotein N-acyltransferase, partial [Candidatus Eremiobacteraeota bacterium]|nr:apolipoprotein N-acyltransferase [Candidatus Eremiobacteraeota bacterium]